MWVCNKAVNTDLEGIPSRAVQRAIVRNLDKERFSDVPKGIKDKNNVSNFEGMVTAKEVATTSFRRKLQEVQHVREESGEAVPTAIVNRIELALEGIEMKRKNA